jgi:HD-GYP domain-containing protein (c-di-GMP phosphodiesterase class II)
MATLISVVVAAIVIFTLRNEVGVIAMAQTRQSADYFSWHIRDQLKSGFQDKALIQRELDRIASVRKKRLVGITVLANIYDIQGQKIAGFSDQAYEYQDEIKSWLSSVKTVMPDKATGDFEIRRINDHPHIRISVPISGDNDTTLAWVETVVLVSDHAYNVVVWRIIRAVLIIIAVVLLTTLLLYPVIIRLMNKLTGLSINLLDANMEIIKVLGSAIAKKDSDTDAHNYRVTLMAVKLAEHIGLKDDEVRSLIKGAFLHDVGKIGIPDAVLLKPGKLDKEEFSVMKQHVNHGLDIIERSAWLQDAAAVVGGHHEKYDGNGYPAGNRSNSVPILARIFALADVFDALTCKRPYKEPFSYETAIDILEEGRGNHFDPNVLDSFIALSKTFYETIAMREDDGLKDELDAIVRKYFTSNILDHI